MNELALFAGAGGGLLASNLLGWRTVCAVELDEYCRCVLTQRQNDGQLFPPFPIWDDVRTFDGRTWCGKIDIITGGFPCQAFSTAARGRNKREKDLWCEMRRIIQQARPHLVFAENVSKRAIEKAQSDLLEDGYNSKYIKLSAKDLGADHIRERYWLLAYTDYYSQLFLSIDAKTRWVPKFYPSIWETFSGKLRVSDGVAYRMDRIKSLGNGQVPIVAAKAFLKLYHDIFNEKCEIK